MQQRSFEGGKSLLSSSHTSEDREKKQELQSCSLQNEKHNHRKLTKINIWITALCNSIKLWAMPWRATLEERTWWRILRKRRRLEMGMANYFSILALRTPLTVWKGKGPPRLVGVQYTTWEEQIKSSRRNEEAEPKQKWRQVVDMIGESKVWCCKEQYFIGTWNVMSMNQGKLEVVKQEVARVNIDILGVSELKCSLTKLHELKSVN